MRQKKDCFGCRAKASRFSCGLDYKLKSIDIKEGSKITGMTTVPDEPCPKPRTYKELIEEQQKRHLKRCP